MASPLFDADYRLCSCPLLQVVEPGICRRPTKPLHLTAARLRFGMKLKRYGWAAAGDWMR